MKHGSLQNHLSASARVEWKKPCVGDGATLISYTDRNPYTVVRVSDSGKRAWVKADDYKRTDAGGMTDVGQTWEFTPNPSAPEVEVRWTGKRWVGSGQAFVMGKREKHHDFSF